MEELVNAKAGKLSVLDNLAAQAQMFVQNACMNLLQLGRVLCEAKPLVQHGQWEGWVKTNTNMSKRQAEQCMKAYREFGLNQQIAALGTTKILKLLPLSDDEREDLMSGNDVSAMSTRQLDEAIREQKAKLKKEAREEVREELERTQAEKQKIQKDLQDAVKNSEDAYRDKDMLQRENIRLKQELKERDELLEEQQADYNRAQEELLNVKSSIAKGDAERIPSDRLTVDTFGSAVRAFIGTCARMPHMSTSFSAMEPAEKADFDELLRTVESWAADARKALDTVIIDGEVINDVE